MAGGENVQGETVMKMDRYADEVLLDCLAYRDQVSVMVSEENQEPVVTKNVAHGKYVVLFDPLDGSSNLDCNVAVGTIFAVYGRRPHSNGERDALEDVLQPGTQMLAAGYVLYSSSTVLAYTTGDGVHMFTLDPMIGAYVLSQRERAHAGPEQDLQLQRGQRRELPAGGGPLPHLGQEQRGRPLHQPLRRLAGGRLPPDVAEGGRVPVPADGQAAEGQAAPAVRVQPHGVPGRAGRRRASDGQRRILEKVPTDLHERTPLYVGSKEEVETVLDFLGQPEQK